jgi:transposase
MRSFGQEISANRRRQSELSIQQRDSIISKSEAGVPSVELAEEFNCTKRCINKTIQRYKEQHHNASRPCSRRPSILTRRETRMLYRAAQKSPKSKYLALLQDTSLQQISKRTAYRALKKLKPQKL